MRARSFWSHSVIGSGLLLASAALATSVPALAQSTSGSSATPYPPACSSVPPTESDRAHMIYQAGKVQYDDKNYDAAIAQFREAYKRDCSKHDLLIIISRAYELKGDKVEALKALEMYVDRVPSSPDIATHRIGIENLKRQIAAAPPPTATVTAPAPTATVAPPPEMRDHTALPWVVVGIGGASIITGAILLVVAPKVPPNCNESSGSCAPPVGANRMDPAVKDALAKDQNQAGTSVGERTGGLIAIIAGAGVLGAGLLWHFLEPTGPVEKTGKIEPRLAPAIAPGYAGASLGGSF
jgi:tetratricopeptide (TPR) repeat protein